MPVHPHVRGEDTFGPSGAAALRGSPPRAWGRLNTPIPPRSNARFTPTCVGKTLPAPVQVRLRPVHPHVRGEDAECIAVGGGRYGSPPRAWGRLGGRQSPQRGRRFTPTCVGKTGRGRRRPPGPPVHPHVRGEDDRRGRMIDLVSRFTPTCVGKTPTHRSGGASKPQLLRL